MGRGKLDKPIVIPMSDVDTIEKFQYDESNTNATAVTIVLLTSLALFVVWITTGFGVE